MSLRPFLFLLLFGLLGGVLQAQDVRLLEFLATNTTGISDENGIPQPWIELWNPSATAKVTLTSWTLSNGTVTWAFPAVEIMPDEQMIVWASGKNRIATTAPLHTSFTPPAGGGTLTLNRPDGSVASQFSGYPAQQPNISWGRDEWDAATTPTQTGFYKEPTPGVRNNFTGSGVAGKVLPSVDSCAFINAFTVTLAQATPATGAVIRYTSDGSVPTTSSPVYASPITISGTQLVRARVYQAGRLPGETETRGYLLLDGTTSGFSSAMPIVVISNFGQGDPPDTADQASYTWVWEPATPDNRARFTNQPTLTSRTVVDRRGSSTLWNPKYNVNVEMRKSRSDDDHDVSLLGMAAGSDYVFGGPFDFDRSELHNPFMYGLSRQVGRYAPDVRLAEVFMEVSGGALNFTNSGGGDYFGIYNIMEKVRRDPERVQVHKLETYDNDAVGKTGGFIFKVDRLDSGDSGFSAGGQHLAYYYPKESQLKSPQRDPQEQYLSTAIADFNSALQGTNWRSPTLGYAAYLDVPEAIDHHLLNSWALNIDGLRLSGYWHKERGGKLIPGPIWDFDRALSSTDGRDSNPNTWRAQTGDLGTDFFNYTWWNRLFLDPDFYQKYIDRWQELRRGPFSQAAVEALLDSLNAKMSDEAVTRDLVRWGKSKRAWSSPFTGASYPASQASEVQRIKDWLQQRASFFDSQWVGAVSASVVAGNVVTGTQVSLSGPAGATIYYTLDGSDPRPSGGAAPSSKVAAYTGSPLAITATTRLRARAYDASWPNSSAVLTGANNPPLRSAWGGLTSARYSTDMPASPDNLAISEIHYHPANPTATELASNPVLSDSDFEFIELHNRSAVPLDLGGLKFTAGVSFAFSGENAVTLAPGAYLMVASNPATFVARYGSSLAVVGPWVGNLDNQGEQLTLSAASGATIIDLTYDDAWYPGTDGQGASLIIVNEQATPAAWSTLANWRSSALAGGSPGKLDLADVTPPVIPSSFTPAPVPTGTGGMASLPDYRSTIGATDNVGIVSLTQNPAPLTTYEVGTVRVSITAVDANSNASAQTFEVKVVDGTPPLLAGTFSPMTISTGSGGTTPAPDLARQVQATDNVGVVSITQLPAAGSPLTVGTQAITLHAADAAGNVGTKVIPVEVLDATAPALGGTFSPLALRTEADGLATLPDYLTQAISSDNVGVASVTQFPAARARVGLGTTVVTVKATDPAGNASSVTCQVQVADGTPPSISAPSSSFSPLRLTATANQKLPLPDYTKQAVVLDNVGVTKVSQLPAAGTPIGLGDTSLQLTAHDAAGNVSSLSFVVSVSLNSVNSHDPLPGVPEAISVTFGIPAISDSRTIAYVARWKTATGRGSGIICGNPATLLVAEGDAVPSLVGATFRSFSDPVLNAEGGIAFLATVQEAGQAVRAVLITNAYPGGALTLVAQTGAATGETDGTRILSFRSISLQGGEVLYVAKLQGGRLGDVGVYRQRADRITERVVRTGQPFDGTSIQGIQVLNAVAGSPGQGRAHREGEVTFLAVLQNGLQAIVQAKGSVLQILAKNGTTSSQLLPGSTFQSFSPVAANHSATAMAVRLTLGAGGITPLQQRAIFLRESTTSEPIAQTGRIAPETGARSFQSLGNPVLASATNAVAFPALLSGPTEQRDSLWWKPAGGTLRLLARAGQHAPGTPDGAVWKSFSSLAITGHNGETPLFYARLKPGSGSVQAANDAGVWALGADGKLNLIMRTGETSRGLSLKKITVLSAVPGSPGVTRSFNEAGTLIYRATFSDASESIVIVDLP